MHQQLHCSLFGICKLQDAVTLAPQSRPWHQLSLLTGWPRDARCSEWGKATEGPNWCLGLSFQGDFGSETLYPVLCEPPMPLFLSCWRWGSSSMMLDPSSDRCQRRHAKLQSNDIEAH